MKMSINRTKTATIALVLALTVATTFVACLPVAKAASTLQLYLFLSVNPNPIGVGQTVTISVFTEPIPPTGADRFTGLSVTITHDSTTETLGPVTSGPLGNWVWTYVPSVTGTYQVQFHIPDQPFPSRNLVYKGGDSQKVALVVQQEPIEPLPQTPLPTEYWTYPINAQNHLWASISGSWLQINYNASKGGPASGNPNFYSTGPKTAHILWRYQHQFGGIEGGYTGPVAYYEGHEYELKFSPGILINNYFYQYAPVGDRVQTGTTPLCAFDIATGQIAWSKPIAASWGQIFRFDSSNRVGLHAYLWRTVGSTWMMYDAFNGNFLMNFTNARSGGVLTWEPGTGNMLVYMLNSQQGWMAMWNFTKACVGTTTGNGVITFQSQAEKDQYGIAGGSWSPRTTALNDWMRGIQWNVTIPITPIAVSFSSGKISAPGGVAIAQTSFNAPQLINLSRTQIYGYSLNNKNPGYLWGPVNMTAATTTSYAIGSDTFVLLDPNRMLHVGYDIHTGRKLWDSDPMTQPWGAYGDLQPLIAYDKLYASAYDGLHCWDIKTGKQLWHFTSGNSGLETPYGTWVGRNTGGLTIGDGKVYWSTGVWHPSPIMQRGDRLYCVDAFTGKNIWNITFFTSLALLAQGHYITMNGYDNNIYCFNKGPSATTVSVGPKTLASGSSTTIEGTVTDQSPGAPGTPAIADKFMGKWMDYLYMQQSKPMDAFGVPVMLQALRVDDGSIIDIGSVYSDINGHYEYLWTPPTTGTYKILASFTGSDAYWPSSAETALGVTAAPPPAEPVETPAYPDYTPIFAGMTVAIIAVAILVVYDIFRKRK